jgi:transposase-like protein
MSKKKIKTTKGRPEDRTPEEKLQLVLDSGKLEDYEFGEFLRKNGVHEAQLQQWKTEALGGLGNVAHSETKKRITSKEAQEIRVLKKQLKNTERELKRKDKALAEAAALVILKKKAEAIWGDGDDDTE